MFKKRLKILSQEAELIHRVRKGDKQAFTTLVNLNEDRLYRYCFYLTGSHALADDIYQEAMIKAFRKIQSLDEGSSFRSWCFKIAHNTYIDYLRLKKNADHENIDNAPEQVLKSNTIELKNTIEMALSHLDPVEKQVVLLIDLGEHSYEDAGEITQLSYEALQWKLREGRRKFKEYFVENEIEVTGIFVLPKKGRAGNDQKR